MSGKAKLINLLLVLVIFFTGLTAFTAVALESGGTDIAYVLYIDGDTGLSQTTPNLIPLGDCVGSSCGSGG